ncbi:MAG: hypothetical protein GF401_07630 [Chitinivibrionales bacterium]|nr:hypothetical protein [Chitinivibrionales bacterium]
MRFQKETVILAAIAVLSAVLVLFFSFAFPLHQHGDNCGYMILGMAFAQGKGFVDISQPSMPHFLWWPPGFPLFISAFFKIFGPWWYVLKTLLFIGLFVTLYFFARYIYKKEKSLFAASAILCALGFSSALHLMSSYLYSEIYFVICSILFFILWDRWNKKLTVTKIAVLSLCALYIGTIRNIGLALPLAFALYLGFKLKRNDKKALRLSFLFPLVLIIGYASAALVAPGFQIGSFGAFFGVKTYEHQRGIENGETQTARSSHGSNRKTSEVFINKIRKIGFSLRGYMLTLIPQTLLRTSYYSFPMSKTKALLTAIITIIVLIGWYTSISPYPLPALYTFVYMGVLLFYGPLYIRLLVPIVPFLFVYLYRGIRAIIGWKIKKPVLATSLIALLWTGVVADNAYWTFSMPRKDMKASFSDRQYQKALQWAIINIGKDDIVACQTNHYLFLMRDALTVPVESIHSQKDVFNLLKANNVRYLIVTKVTGRRYDTQWKIVEDVIKQNKERFMVVFGDPETGTYIVKYVPDTHQSPQRPAEMHTFLGIMN